ncbi:hypothetical protein FY528_08445 [Hymenobacter lutimineralis]|uniref:Uncharacterized protein n=1 Tax=Hymenobacter lutimineralis TaxID=2606448 RepID=A0A5D6V6D9_9BACT|nr:hypothetical protein [Hymenobacter lutimineralis]TYZ10488.1 hypothetical protein FY528_08445 [Hymenobacter lutimineralis]
MKTLYRFLLLLALLLISHFSTRAQGLQAATHVTITGFGDPEPDSPSERAMARLHEEPVAPASQVPATPDSVVLLPPKTEKTRP